jgi:hypothetical protein
MGDELALVQLVPVLQNRIIRRSDPAEVSHDFLFFFGSGLNSIWPPGASDSDSPFWKAISPGMNVTRPVTNWATGLMGVQADPVLRQRLAHHRRATNALIHIVKTVPECPTVRAR